MPYDPLLALLLENLRNDQPQTPLILGPTYPQRQPPDLGPEMQRHLVPPPRRPVDTGSVGGGLEGQLSALMNNLAIQRTPEESAIYNTLPATAEPGLLEQMLLAEDQRVRNERTRREAEDYTRGQQELLNARLERESVSKTGEEGARAKIATELA